MQLKKVRAARLRMYRALRQCTHLPQQHCLVLRCCSQRLCTLHSNAPDLSSQRALACCSMASRCRSLSLQPSQLLLQRLHLLACCC